MVSLVKARPRKDQPERLALTEDYAYMQITQFIISYCLQKMARKPH